MVADILMEDAAPYQNFKAIAKQIKEALENDTEGNPLAIQEKISQLSMLTGSAAALQANAKKALLQKELELINKYKNEGLQASVLMRMISAECFEEACVTQEWAKPTSLVV